ncbi:MAG: hypothetical protein ACM3ZQ_02870 [Bacillota bacterium]
MAQYGVLVLAIYGAAALLGVVMRLFASRRPPSISLVVVVKGSAQTVEATIRQIIRLLKSGSDLAISDLFIVDASGDPNTGDILLQFLRQHPEMKLLTAGVSDLEESEATAKALGLTGGDVVWVVRLEQGRENQRVVDQLDFLVNRHVHHRTEDLLEDTVN